MLLFCKCYTYDSGPGVVNVMKVIEILQVILQVEITTFFVFRAIAPCCGTLMPPDMEHVRPYDSRPLSRLHSAEPQYILCIIARGIMIIHLIFLPSDAHQVPALYLSLASGYGPCALTLIYILCLTKGTTYQDQKKKKIQNSP
jgi:hypothetical protein